MQVTVEFSSTVVKLEVNEELRLSSLVMVAFLKLNISESPEEFNILKGDRVLNLNREKTLKELNICDGDTLVMSKITYVNEPLSSHSEDSGQLKQRLNNLIKSIRVSANKTITPYESEISRRASTLYNNMKKRNLHDEVMVHFPRLAETYDGNPEDLGGFVTAFREHALKQRSLKKWRERLLDKRLEKATVSFPECFAKTPMLYLQAKLNETDVIALGAQASIITDEAVKKCSMLEFVDNRFCVFANGVGGTRSTLGRIFACDILVAGMTLLCAFDVLPGDACNVDVIIGVDVLSKNQAIIDVTNRTIRFGDRGSANFIQLEDAEKLEPFGGMITDGRPRPMENTTNLNDVAKK
ncbi:hypothetical protein RB195_002717 [Necator americanus]|uniref:Aspartic peptidase DDI1-type domain-containing protein n=1 Tax=Necator americanus TaxID=51031 RepID=A0ABR1DKC9_NECAM